jgi:hypothetical protein
MTTRPPMYRPTDAFRERLEQEVLDRVRRAEPSRAHALPRRMRWAKAAIIVITSASLGATAGFASAQIRQGSERDSLLASARAEAMLAKVRVDLARAQADDVSLKVRVGAGDQQSLDAATAELRDMEARRNRGGLDIEEITASGLPPRDDLTAPLVGNRDYVKMRIEVELTAVQARLKAAEGRQALAERMARVGAGPELPATVAVDVASAKAEMSVLAEKLKLRAEFLDRGTSAAELATRMETAQLQADAYTAQAELLAARERLVVIQKRRSAGMVGDVELLRAQLAVKEREVALQQLAIRLRLAK